MFEEIDTDTVITIIGDLNASIGEEEVSCYGIGRCSKHEHTE